MTLEERYNAAGPDSYAGRVRLQQAADAGTADTGVNFFDGVGRGQGNNAPDEYQDEFSRNEAGSFRYGGNDKTPAGTNDGSYPLSRWLQKGLTKAFESGESYFQSSRFNPNYADTNGSELKVHKFAPLPDRDFISKLGDLSKGRVLGRASGPIG